MVVGLPGGIPGRHTGPGARRCGDSIHASEQPKRDFVAEADLNIVGNDIAVGQVCNPGASFVLRCKDTKNLPAPSCLSYHLR